MSSELNTQAVVDSVGEHFGDAQAFEQMRLEMLKFAVLQLQDECLAEDAVQEAMLSAYKNLAKFARKSAFKTWVFAILKNKIIDILRKGNREISVNPLADKDEEGLSNTLFDHRGHWTQETKPESWSAPMESVKQQQFWQVFEACLNHLPETLGRAFMMREFIELERDEICETLAISESNLYVILYRSRLRLRECLENNWFTEGESL